MSSSVAAFDQTLALEDQTFAGLFESPDERALYDEYLRGFDDVPTLTDLVAVPPPRILPPDFRFGERKDVRKSPREDVETLRESKLRELESLYREYVQPVPVATTKLKAAKPKKKRQKRRKK